MPKTMSTAWFLRSTGTTAMSEDMGEDFRSSGHSILDSEQENCEDQFDDWDWVETEMQREAVREGLQWNKEMEMHRKFNKRLANLTVRYLNMQGAEVHSSNPCRTFCQLEPPGSFREAWIAQLHEGNNPDRCLSLQELRVRRQETNKPIPPETLQHRSSREVLLLELDSSPAGPIPIEGTKLVLGGDVISDDWSWHELLDRSFNGDVVEVQVVYASKEA